MSRDSAQETHSRAFGGIFGDRSRAALGLLLNPVERAVDACGITPHAVTIFSLIPAMAAGWYLSQGSFAWAGILYLASGCCDFIDGRLARRSGRQTPDGALLDSVLDRYTESAFLLGAAWYYRDHWAALAVALLLIGSLLVPYIRARSEGLGLRVTTGFLQRPERVVILGVAAILTRACQAFVPNADARLSGQPFLGVVVFLAVVSHLTAIQRLSHAVNLLRRQAAASELETPKA